MYNYSAYRLRIAPPHKEHIRSKFRRFHSPSHYQVDRLFSARRGSLLMYYLSLGVSLSNPPSNTDYIVECPILSRPNLKSVTEKPHPPRHYYTGLL